MFLFFMNAWRGEATLFNAFWFIHFLFGLIIKTIIGMLLSMLYPHFVLVEQGGWIAAIAFPYTLFSAICVWRCGKNTSSFWWRLLSRIMVSLAVIFGAFYLVMMVIGFSII